MATSTHTPPRHVISRAVVAMREQVRDVAEASVWSMDRDETASTLVACTELEAMIAELKLRVAAHADDAAVGEASGATSTAVWWAHATNQTRREAFRQLHLATALAAGHEPVRVALAAGDLVVEQAQVIVRAVEELPADLDTALVEHAERHLVAEARHHDAKTLRILGRRLFEVIAPEEADARGAKLLEHEERAAAEAVRFTMAEDGHGRVHGRFTLDALTGAMLKKALLAIAAPKHQAAQGPLGERRPGPERMGRAFAEYIQRYPVDQLPHAGGLNATVVVTMGLDTLTGGLKAAQLDTGERISPGLARKLACEAGIIPAVLGGPSEVLDVGRKARFHTAPMRIAMTIRDRGCTAEGCDWPPGLCHAHHDDLPWAKGGTTSAKDGRLLCPKHHTRAHDPTFTMTKLPGGKVAFTRRT
jgi:hypothetical protein